MKSKRRPFGVILGVIMLLLSNLLVMSRISTDKALDSGFNLLDFFILVPAGALVLFLIYKIFLGRRWARTSYLVVVMIVIFLNIGNLFFWFESNLILFQLFVLEKGIALAGFAVLYGVRSPQWFAPLRAPKKLTRQEKKKKRRSRLIFVILAVLIVGLYSAISYFGPEVIVDKIGVQNGYLVGFLVAFFGGLNAATAISYFTVLSVLIVGGLNPIILALLTGTSLALGDMILFYFGGKGRELITGRWDKEIDGIALFFKTHKLEKFIPILSYIYIGFLPLPNDWLLLFLATIEYPPRKMNLIIALGDYSLAFFVSLLIANGIVIF